MRIVYLNPCGQMGGAETSLRAVLQGIRSAEPAWDLHLVVGEDGPLVDVARGLKVEVTVLPFPPALARVGDSGTGRLATAASLGGALLPAAKYTRKLTRLLKSLKPDIIHTNGLKMHLLGAWARPKNTCLVWHIHDYVGRRPVMSRLLRYHATSCTAAITNSKSVAAEFRALLPYTKTTTIYNAIDLERFSPIGATVDLDAMAKLPPAPATAVRVGLVGTFARWKGHSIFLQALSRLSPDLKVRGYVIGGPIYQTAGSQWSLDELRDEAARLGISERAGFTGFISNVPDAMRSLDVIVHASTTPEPFGMVIIEGMGCEKAVIASRAGGSCEIITEGENALAHTPGDAAGLAQQIERLVKDAALRRQIGKAGRTMAEKRFGGERLASELLALYQSIFTPRMPSNEKIGAAQPIRPQLPVRAPDRQG